MLFALNCGYDMTSYSKFLLPSLLSDGELEPGVGRQTLCQGILLQHQETTHQSFCLFPQTRYTPADFKYSLEYIKYISSLSNELKTKDIDRKPKTPRPPTHKGWYVLM